MDLFSIFFFSILFEIGIFRTKNRFVVPNFVAKEMIALYYFVNFLDPIIAEFKRIRT